MRERRILLCTQPVDGGVGRHVRDLALGLGDLDWDVTVCSPSPPEGLADNVRHIPLALDRSVDLKADLRHAARLAHVTRRLAPAIVHAHSSKAGAAARVAHMANPRVPVVYTPHGYSFAGHFSRPGERRAYRLAERALTPMSSRVVCVCEAEARLARSVGAGQRVRVVHNGVDPEPVGAPDPSVVELRGDGPLIGALTQLRPGKGIETLLAAMPAVLARVPDARLVVCGEGPERDSHLGLAAQLGITHAVQFIGRRDDPLAVLRAIDLFVHASWAEAFPYVILEAMSVGVPVVASAVGGVGEAVEDAHTGLLVAPRDPHALGSAITRLVSDSQLRRDMGERGRKRVLRDFTLEAMIARLSRVYDELMGLPDSRPRARGHAEHLAAGCERTAR